MGWTAVLCLPAALDNREVVWRAPTLSGGKNNTFIRDVCWLAGSGGLLPAKSITHSTTVLLRSDGDALSAECEETGI